MGATFPFFKKDFTILIILYFSLKQSELPLNGILKSKTTLYQTLSPKKVTAKISLYKINRLIFTNNCKKKRAAVYLLEVYTKRIAFYEAILLKSRI